MAASGAGRAALRQSLQQPGQRRAPVAGAAPVKPVYVLGRRLFDQTIQEIESGTINEQGDITLMLRGDVSPLMVARMNPEPYVLFGAGDEVPVELAGERCSR